jgi:MFS family permease
VSLLAGIVFFKWIVGYSESHFDWIFIGLALLYGLGFILMCVFVREGNYPPPDPRPPRPRGNIVDVVKSVGEWVKAYFRECFADRYYLWIYGAMMLGAMAFGPVNSFGVLYAKSLGVPMAAYGNLLVITYMISFALSYALGWAADRFHPLRVGAWSMALYAAANLWAGFVATTPATFAVAFVAHGVISGCFYTVQVPIFQRLFPVAKFGQLYSAANLVGGSGLVLVPAAAGLMLDETGYVYRYTYLFGGWIALFGFVTMLVVDRMRARREGHSGRGFEAIGAPAGKG